MSILFEVANKSKISFQLDIPLDYTFEDVSGLVFEHFNLNKKDFPNSKEYNIKFIFKSKVCQNNNTLAECGVTPQSKISLFIPSKLLSVITGQSTTGSTQNTTSNNQNNNISNDTNNLPKENQTISINPNEEIKNQSNDTPKTNDKPEIKETKSQSNESSITDEIVNLNLSIPQLHKKTDDASMHQIVINLANPGYLHQLVGLDFNIVDAAYALVYKNNIDCCIDLITLGISANPEFRYHINEMISGRLTTTEAVYHDIELAKIEARYKGENEDVAAAAVMCEAAMTLRIEDDQAKLELKKKHDEISALHDSEIKSKIQDDYQNGKQIIHYSASQKRPFICDFKKVVEFSANQYQQSNPQAQLINPNMYNPQFVNPQASNPNMYNPHMMNQYAMYQQMYNQEVMKTKSYTDSIIEQFNDIFDRIPSMTPDNFVNPFAAVYDAVSQYCDEGALNLYKYGKGLNFDQLKFLYNAVKVKNIEINEAVQFLMISNGDIGAAESLTN